MTSSEAILCYFLTLAQLPRNGIIVNWESPGLGHSFGCPAKDRFTWSLMNKIGFMRDRQAEES